MCATYTTIIEIQNSIQYIDIMFVSGSKSTKIHFYYTFCFIITVVYFSSIVYNVSIAEEDLDEGKNNLSQFDQRGSYSKLLHWS